MNLYLTWTSRWGKSAIHAIHAITPNDHEWVLVCTGKRSGGGLIDRVSELTPTCPECREREGAAK